MVIHLSLRISFARPEKKDYEVEVLIIGSGPAGITAGIYSARYMLSTILIGDILGGQASKANVIENYPGLLSIKASELIDKFVNHLKSYDVNYIIDEVITIEKNDDSFIAHTKRGTRVKSLAIIYAAGAKDKELNVPGEKEFIGKGVSYCSTCDAAFFKDSENVAVVGGGDVAFESAYILSQYAKRVTLIHRRSEFRAQPILIEKVKKTGNVNFVLNSIVTEIYGDYKVRGIKVKNLETGIINDLSVDGVFINIGYEPKSELAKRLGVNVDERGYIVVSPYMETNVKGFFAAGDVTNLWTNFKQIISSAAQGAVAAYSAYKYIMMMKKS